MQDRKYLIGLEFAKREIGFNRENDGDDQDKLRLMITKADEYTEEVDQAVTKMIATILRGNPDIDVSELELVILTSLEKKVQQEEITSITSIGSPETLKTIQKEVQAEIQHNGNLTQATINDDNSLNVATTSMIAITALLNKDMSPEEVLKLDEEYKKSDEYKQSMTNAYEQLYNGETSEISEKAGNVVRMNKVMNNTQKYCVQNRGGKADIATLTLIARGAITDDIALKTRALMLAKSCGFANVINQDGTINIEEVQKSMLTAVKGDSQLEEKFSTVEKLLAIAQESNQRAAKRATREASLEKDAFGEKMKTASTANEKQALVEGKIKTDRVKKLLKVMISVGQSTSEAPISKYMEELYDLDSNLAKQVLPEVSTRIDNTSRKHEITSFLENKTNLQAKSDAIHSNDDGRNR